MALLESWEPRPLRVRDQQKQQLDRCRPDAGGGCNIGERIELPKFMPRQSVGTDGVPTAFARPSAVVEATLGMGITNWYQIAAVPDLKSIDQGRLRTDRKSKDDQMV
jgi:hypothetical protein